MADDEAAAVRREDVERWGRELEEVVLRIGGRFSRREARERARAYLQGLLSPVQRKNGWQLAEQLGDARPYGVQHLLGRSEWDADALRDDLRRYVVEHLADREAVLIVDETGFLKKGDKSAGVARQYTGTAGRIENAQVGVFLAYSGRRGTAFLDRALYLPEAWIDAPERLRAAGVPEGTAFATKGELARAMLDRALDAGVQAAWVLGDEVYGADGPLRRRLEERRQPYVLAVRKNQKLWVEFEQRDVAAIVAEARAKEWRRIVVADGSKGPRKYDWFRTPFNHPYGGAWGRWLLARRSLSDPTEVAYYFAFGPADASLTKLARAAGRRWAVETGFEEAKQQVGLADYEVRSWSGWHRHVTLALFAHALLAVVRLAASGPIRTWKKGASSGPGSSN